MALQKAMVSSKSNEWITPQDLFDELNAEFSFLLDVAASDDNHKCDLYLTIKDDGLIHEWSKSNWMNPPYGGHTGKWIKKAYEESLKGNTTVCLIVSSTDRSYWHDYIFPFANEVRFIRGRLKFSSSKSTAPFASAIIVFRPHPHLPDIVKESLRSPRLVYEHRASNQVSFTDLLATDSKPSAGHSEAQE